MTGEEGCGPENPIAGEPTVKKFNPFVNDVIFIDGLPGSGKSILLPIISGMSGVEKAKYEHIYEYVCVLADLGKITKDAAHALIQTFVDLSQYNNLIGREINLRWRDVSGFSNNPGAFRYIKRLFGNEGDLIVKDINTNNLALCVISHEASRVSYPLFDCLGDRLKFIEVVRHPLYMVGHWSSYLERFHSSRIFTLALDYEGNKVPWFAHGWEEEYVGASPREKAMMAINKMYASLDSTLASINENGGTALVINFESLVFNTDRVMRELSEFLSRDHHPRLKHILRRQKIPRETIMQGRGFFSYGWQRSVQTESEVYAQLSDQIHRECRPEVVEAFEKTIEWYNLRFPNTLAKYQI